MARPKEKSNTAFQQKCSAASDKLLQFQVRTLKDDIAKLYTDELFTDVTVKTGSRNLCLHRCILIARSEDLCNYISSSPRDDSSDVSIITTSHSTDTEQAFRYLYAEDDPSEALSKLDKCLCLDAEQHLLPEGQAPSGINEFGDREIRDSPGNETLSDISADLHVISENITNTSLDLVKAEAESHNSHIDRGLRNSERVNEHLNLVCQGSRSPRCLKETESNCNYGETGMESCPEIDTSSEKNIHKLAEEIVEQVIREAWNIVGCIKEETVSEIDRKSGECDKSVIEHEEKVKENGGVQGDCDKRTGGDGSTGSHNSDKKSEKSSDCFGDSDTEIQERHRNNCRFKPSRKYETSLQRLLERVYGVKMLVRPCCQLGEDLLRMLLEHDFTDCVIEVQGEQYQAHRCILAARSSYFAAMLGGSWRESGLENIILEGIEPQVLKQTLLYLYGGVIEVDPSCPLGGLVLMADMYGMDGLKEVVAHNLNVQYCHFFHRPCAECITGVPEALALTMMYNMEAMKEKCVKWINKNFAKVWASKSLATLPQEVLEYCISSAVKDLALNNVLDVMIDCQRLNEKTPRLKWTEPVFDMTNQLMEAAIEFASENFISLISGSTFTKIHKEGISFNKQPLEDIFSMIIQALSPENACLAYLSLNRWIKTIEAQSEEKLSEFSEEFVDFVNILFKKCREHLCLYIHQVANTTQWELLAKDMQENIMQEASYVCIDTNRGRMARPKLTSMQKKISATSPLSLKEYFECHFGKSRSQASNIKARKSPQGVKPGTSLNATSGNSASKGTVSKTAQKVITKSDPETHGNRVKSLKDSGKRMVGTKGKSIPVLKRTSQHDDSLKNATEEEITAGCHRNLLPSSEDNVAVSDTNTADCSCDCEWSISLANLAANIELVDPPEGINFHEERLMPILNVNFHMPT